MARRQRQMCIRDREASAGSSVANTVVTSGSSAASDLNVGKIIAAKKAIEQANVDVKDINAVIVGTSHAARNYPAIAIEIQKELGHILDYGVYVSDGASSPNVWLTISYENMAAMEQTKEKSDAFYKALEERYGDDEEELDKISKGYEEIRTMIDNQRINQVIFEM